MTSKEFRHSHLLKIINDCGTIEVLASKTGINPQYLSQCKNKTRGIGNKTARSIEEGVGLPEGTMDRPPNGENLDTELAILLSTMPEDQAIQAMVDAVPDLSKKGIQKLTTALLEHLNASSTPE